MVAAASYSFGLEIVHSYTILHFLQMISGETGQSLGKSA